jgi:hypothetical protein
MLIVGRAVAGLGTAGLLNGGLTIVANSVPMERRPGMCDTYIHLANWLHGHKLAKITRSPDGVLTWW